MIHYHGSPAFAFKPLTANWPPLRERRGFRLSIVGNDCRFRMRSKSMTIVEGLLFSRMVRIFKITLTQGALKAEYLISY